MWSWSNLARAVGRLRTAENPSHYYDSQLIEYAVDYTELSFSQPILIPSAHKFGRVRRTRVVGQGVNSGLDWIARCGRQAFEIPAGRRADFDSVRHYADFRLLASSSLNCLKNS